MCVPVLVFGVAPRHHEGMWKTARLGISLLLLGAAAGCSSAETSPGTARPTPNPYGGQTGSLTPDCGIAPLSKKAGASVPAGDSAFVVYSTTCGSAPTPEFDLRDALGMLVSHRVEQLDTGVYLVRSDSALSPGNYSITPIGSSTPMPAATPVALTVADASALPSRLGSFELAQQQLPCDGFAFEFTLDPTTLAYAPLLRLKVQIDNNAPVVWINYGTLAVEAGKAKLVLPSCFGGCLGNGSHSLRITGDIAGENVELAPEALQITQNCPPEEHGTNCAFQPWRPQRQQEALLVLSGFLVIALARKRRTSQLL